MFLNAKWKNDAISKQLDSTSFIKDFSESMLSEAYFYT